MLTRKRPSPLASGQEKIWACAIVQAIGRINFLSDKSQSPYMKTEELNALFGVSKSTGGNKASQIMEALGVNRFSSEYCLPSRLKDHLPSWLIQINGYIVDARSLPREVQVELAQAGHIPAVPDDL
ncbi:DUF6398 domain-containing protein [Armatimonas sp.]|uniref:DUF6398 domain-containing protein n=1 Tax=Armatimonas sp. TaxID=1872638 RepID=UPI003752F4B0